MEQALSLEQAQQQNERRQDTLDSIPEVAALDTEGMSPFVFVDAASSSSTTKFDTIRRSRVIGDFGGYRRLIAY